MTVLVFTRRLDPTADLVITELGRRGVEVFRCDAADFPGALSLSARLDGGRWIGELRTELRSVALEEISAVYYRKPSQFQFGPGLSPDELDWAAGEARFGFGGVLATLPCRWLSHPSAIMTAGFKPLQLATAAAVGFTVPDTVITNDPSTAHALAAGSPTGVVYKSLGGAPFRQDSSVSLFTSPVSPAECAQPSVAGTAHQFQHSVPKAYEVRITVVGDRVFAAGIHAGSTAAHLDWRADYDSLTYTSVHLPNQVHEQCLELVKRLGLSFGCIDLIVNPDGEHVFLEINPNGQWGWIEHHTGLPITAAIADYLEGLE